MQCKKQSQKAIARKQNLALEALRERVSYQLQCGMCSLDLLEGAVNNCLSLGISIHLIQKELEEEVEEMLLRKMCHLSVVN